MSTLNRSDEVVQGAVPAPTSMSINNSKKETAKDEEQVYSVYTRTDKWIIVLLASFCGLFSPLTANIYFPAIPTLVVVFNKSTELINLTVTMYMVLQAFAPMIFGTLADQLGRRILSITCLIILSLSCVGLALVPPSAYWLLVVLRCVQAAGSASGIAIGAGIIGDISVSAERAGYVGLYNVFIMIGPAIGPVLGGALAGNLGWRSIFWFLCIFSASTAILMTIILPETLRSIAGNGSKQVPRIYRPLFPLVGRGEKSTDDKVKVSVNFRNPFPLLRNFDIVLLLTYNGMISGVYYGVVASISTLFTETYPFLNETTVGLCFLAVGGGMGMGSAFAGKVLDWDFKNVKRQWMETTGKMASDESDSRKLADDESFPLEKARLRLMPIFLVLFIGSCVGYGWCLREKVNIAGPLVLQFSIGFMSMAIMNSTQTLIIDLVPKQSSAVSACNNLFRGSLGATLVGVIDLILGAMGPGWAYVLLGGLVLFVSPSVLIVMRIGPQWRMRRRESQP